MTVQSKRATREQQFFRSLRPPELRNAPDEWYQAIAREATRIARAHKNIQRIQRSMEDARYAITQDTWPRTHYRDWITGERTSETSFHESDPVTLCWLVDIAGAPHRARSPIAPEAPPGYANLYDLYDLVEPWARCWNEIVRWCIVGALSSVSSLGLVYRAYPVTWALTATGRELVDLVFGEED